MLISDADRELQVEDAGIHACLDHLSIFEQGNMAADIQNYNRRALTTCLAASESKHTGPLQEHIWDGQAHVSCSG